MNKTKCDISCNIDNFKGDEIIHCMIISVTMGLQQRVPEKYFEAMITTLKAQATQHDWTIHTLAVSTNHIAMKVQIDPDTTVYNMVCAFQDSVEHVLKEEFPSIKNESFWGDLSTQTVSCNTLNSQQENLEGIA